MAVENKKQENNILINCRCENHKGKNPISSKEFYKSNSPMADNGKAPFCKKCIKDMINYEDINTIYSVLQALDIPYLFDYYDKCVLSEKDTFGNYLRMANSLTQFKGLTWKDSMFDSSISKSNTNNIEKDTEKIVEDEVEYNEEWRGSYAKSDLKYLEDYYNDLKTDFKIVTRNHKDYARKIAKASLAMDRAYDDMINGVQGSDTRYKNLKDTFDQLSKSAQFAEDKRGANEVGLGSFGVVFDKVEKHNWIPSHVPLKKDDFDKILDSFSTIEKSL